MLLLNTQLQQGEERVAAETALSMSKCVDMRLAKEIVAAYGLVLSLNSDQDEKPVFCG